MGNRGRHRKDNKVDHIRVRTTLGLATLAVVGGGALAPAAQADDGGAVPVTGADAMDHTGDSSGGQAAPDGNQQVRPGKFGTGGAVGELGDNVAFGSKEFMDAVRKDQMDHAEGTPERTQADQFSWEQNNNNGLPYAGGDLPATREALERACGRMTVPENGCTFTVERNEQAPSTSSLLPKADGSTNNSSKPKNYKYTKADGVTETKGWEISANTKVGGEVPAPATGGLKKTIEAGVSAKYGESTATSTTETTEHWSEVPAHSEAQFVRKQPRRLISGTLSLKFPEAFRGETEHSVPVERTMNDPNSAPQIVMQTRRAGSDDPWVDG